MAEGILILNLRRELKKSPRWRKGIETARILRNVLQKRTRSDNVKIGKALNEYLWSGGIKNPPTKLKIRITKSDQLVTADIVL